MKSTPTFGQGYGLGMADGMALAEHGHRRRRNTALTVGAVLAWLLCIILGGMVD